MDIETIVAAIFGMVLYIVCGILFLSLGLWADKSPKPVSFWAGKSVQAEWVTDVAGYNRANAIMWKVYSAVYFLAGILSLLGIWRETFIYASLILTILSAFPGIPILIRNYKKIEKKYIFPEMLDKVDPFC